MRAFPTCVACGRANNSLYRNCDDCRMAWRLPKRKPGGYADQAEALRDMIKTVRALLPHAVNEGDDTAVTVARKHLARAERILAGREPSHG